MSPVTSPGGLLVIRSRPSQPCLHVPCPNTEILSKLTCSTSLHTGLQAPGGHPTLLPLSPCPLPAAMAACPFLPGPLPSFSLQSSLSCILFFLMGSPLSFESAFTNLLLLKNATCHVVQHPPTVSFLEGLLYICRVTACRYLTVGHVGAEVHHLLTKPECWDEGLICPEEGASLSIAHEDAIWSRCSPASSLPRCHLHTLPKPLAPATPPFTAPSPGTSGATQQPHPTAPSRI